MTMDKEKEMIVVPWDFTMVAENALQHAAKISRMVNSSVVLLHIVDRNIKAGEFKKSEDKLKSVADEAASKYEQRIRDFQAAERKKAEGVEKGPETPAPQE